LPDRNEPIWIDVLQPLGLQAAGPEGGDEQERQRDPAEVGEHPGGGDGDLAQERPRAARGGLDRVGDQQPEDRGQDRGDHRQDDRLAEAGQVDPVGGDVDVVRRPGAGAGSWNAPTATAIIGMMRPSTT
jgi:hypothetical protein